MLPFRISTSEGHEPKLSVVEVVQGAKALYDGARWEGNQFFDGETVLSGETLATTDLFSMPEPTSDLVGWRISLDVDVPWRVRDGSWRWSADCFVAVPMP